MDVVPEGAVLEAMAWRRPIFLDVGAIVGAVIRPRADGIAQIGGRRRQGGGHDLAPAERRRSQGAAGRAHLPRPAAAGPIEGR